MGKLSGHHYEVTGITYVIRAHASGKHLTVPKVIAAEFGAQDRKWIGLTVRTGDGVAFDGDVSLASGTEAYYRVSDPETGGLKAIGPHEALEVTARRATRA